jgi:hypothetical protein
MPGVSVRRLKRRASNCWEYKHCGRGRGGRRAPGEKICPAAIATDANGVNRGINGGRVCWAIAGTLCGGRQQGNYAAKLETCLKCDFCKLVLAEEQTEPCEDYRPPKAGRKPASASSRKEH